MNDNSYTDDEVAALPQTEQVFDDSQLNINLQKHDLTQSNYTVYDKCCGNRPFNIGSGNMLVGQKGAYRIVDEMTRK